MIAEDSVLLREGIALLLGDAGIEVVGQVEDGAGLREVVAATDPDLAIVDIRMPPTFTDEGLRAAIEIRSTRPSFPVLVLSQYVEERYASELIGENAQAVGYLLKERVADVADFLDALRRVAAGGTVIDPEVIAQILGRRQAGPVDELTGREQEVMALVAEGRTNRAIAETLHVSGGAVEKHISNIFLKLDLLPAAEDHRRVLAVLQYLRAT